jgi:hypothetical protein
MAEITTAQLTSTRLTGCKITTKENLMTAYLDLFMRDSLTDTATIPSPSGTPYWSPDIIPHTQVANPQTSFGTAASYTTAPAQDIEYGQYNYIYLRGKNTATTAKSGNLQLYWSKSSLVMTPTTWTGQGLQTAAEATTVPLTSIAGAGIAVGGVPFVWNAPTNEAYSYCLIATLSTTEHPVSTTLPHNTWNGFVSWVRNNPNVAWRNLHIVNNLPDPNYARLYVVQNTTSQDAVMAFSTALTNFPVGTEVTQVCAPLNINKTSTTTSTNTTIVSSASVPTGFDGSLQVTVTLPAGGTWPSNGTVVTTSYVGTSSANDVLNLMEFAAPLDQHPPVNLEAYGIPAATGRLVEIGNNTVAVRVSS